jgi:hypothetical protein
MSGVRLAAGQSWAFVFSFRFPVFLFGFLFFLFGFHFFQFVFSFFVMFFLLFLEFFAFDFRFVVMFFLLFFEFFRFGFRFVVMFFLLFFEFFRFGFQFFVVFSPFTFSLFGFFSACFALFLRARIFGLVCGRIVASSTPCDDQGYDEGESGSRELAFHARLAALSAVRETLTGKRLFGLFSRFTGPLDIQFKGGRIFAADGVGHTGHERLLLLDGRHVSAPSFR